MTHVSKKSVPKEISDLMTKSFLESVNDMDSSDVNSFANNLLTPTELEMLSKRLFIIYMLSEGYSTTEISNTTKTTIQTIQRIQLKLVTVPNNEVKAMVSKINKVISKQQLKSTVQKILDTEVKSQTLKPLTKVL